MKRFYLLVFFMSIGHLLHSQVSLQEHNISGYRGFFDLGYTVGTGETNNIGRFELSTSHGILINPYLFVGAGIGVHCYINANGNMLQLAEKKCLPVIPFFIDVHGNLSKGSIVPFIGLKIGYSCALMNEKGEIGNGFSKMGIYVAPSVGVSFEINSQTRLNLSCGYSAQNVTLDHSIQNEKYIKEDNLVNLAGFFVKTGLEF